jgi:hypothetical protein
MQRSHKIILISVFLLVVVSIGFSALQIYKLGLWKGMDAQFGDQHLKTTVALVELHKVRYGRYPETLSDLKFLGGWDPIATRSVWYKTNETGTRYCVEVQRGWVGKPTIVMPAEFWQGTGYDPSLCR